MSESSWEKYKQFHCREYKKLFAGIECGSMEQGVFYVWRERAREKLAECEKGNLSFEAFSEWLKNSE